MEPKKAEGPKFESYAAEWLRHAEHDRKPSTVEFYIQFLRVYVIPRFGELRLDQINRNEVKRFISDLRGRTPAKNTIRLAVTTLRAVLNAAVEDGILAQNPAQRRGRFVKSEKPAREASSLTPVETVQLLTAAREHLAFREHALILTALRTGLRQGELTALQ